MEKNDFFKFINIDEYSITPKYIQLSEAIISAVENGYLGRNFNLPSINDLSYTLDISRDTAEKGYKYLKSKNIIRSVPGKGYQIINADLKRKIRIFLLFNKLSAHKKIIYDSFVKLLGDDVAIDFYIYNNDFTIFKKLILNRKDGYSHYVIIPHFVEGGDSAHEVVNTLPKEKLILLDKKIAGITGKYSAIYENFEANIFDALTSVLSSLKKYHTLKLVFPEKSYFPKEIVNGFKKFSVLHSFKFKIVDDLMNEPLSKGEAYIILMEDDLVSMLERILAVKLDLGTDLGLISYNETPLKKLLLNGITTISTDFVRMGEMAAEMIKKQNIAHQEVPFYVKLRSSL